MDLFVVPFIFPLALERRGSGHIGSIGHAQHLDFGQGELVSPHHC